MNLLEIIQDTIKLYNSLASLNIFNGGNNIPALIF